MSYKFSLYFDGGCKPNPGQGYGSYEYTCQNLNISCKTTLIQFGFMTNNMAEYHAMLHGLKKLWHDSNHGNLRDEGGEEIIPDRIRLFIESDSILLVHQMNRKYKCRVLHIRELRDEAWLILEKFGGWQCSWKRRIHNIERFGH